ncbi:hypothetical protein LTR10_021242 [Elasticomyces elasticus]|uniref:Amino acid transporter transmembrane domain-containing protein n=1 Tax=Exophiala sideris TaxID=1016849 RepID=A0ABR0JFN3_9EURO|nr:hypothetical protein LTR10_021242 [Elasticomyces elasticus]KAK5025355.1 hypothetical protein LTS07_008206 [Exophiala sideris]KAK5032930.1 hypothetical protein LTR13_006895 [Exophiala sideris]KAK5063415.1 hypothetical protein LTR69_004121 [Exophiala sideris]KAK5180752.1 hypothetical protein LTR44_007066 [Eurotiomycetes sp. CCFEE 6388]
MSIRQSYKMPTGETSKNTTKESQMHDADVEVADGELGRVDATRIGAFGQAAAAGGKQYRVLGRWKAGFVFIHTEVGIGILSLPSVLKTLGLIPGLIAILGIGLLATYTAYLYLLFWRRYRHIDNLPDAMYVLGGKPLAIVGAVGLIINLSFACASSVLTMSIALNTLSGHSMCTVAFVGFAALVCYVLCMPRTMNFVSYFSAPATLAIIIPIFIVIGSLVHGKPQSAPAVWEKEMHLVGNPSFRSAFSAILSIFYAFGGRQGFLSVAAEMRDPSRDYVPALIMLQCFAIPMYLITGGAIYGLAGQYVTSPALGSAPLIPAKAAYGILLITLFNTGLFYSHAGIKYLYIVVMRDALKIPEQMTRNNVKSWGIWVSLATAFWTLVFLLANAIPSFSNIIGVSSALLVGWFSFGLPGIFWLHLNKGKHFANWKMTSLAVLSYLLIALALFLNSAGMWASISSLITLFNSKTSTVHGPFTCADNSLF